MNYTFQIRKTLNTGLALLVCTSLCACSTMDKISSIGHAPAMTKIANPVTDKNYQPVSLPMPVPQDVNREKNSLWASNRQTFFKDQRANDVGDIITVNIEIKDKAELDNESARSRDGSVSAGLPSFLGYEGALDRVLPEAIDPANLVGADSTSEHTGTGSIDREEKIEVQLAALITQVLPNGNLVIHGRQEVLVNFEKRILEIDGVIRPQDITIANAISYEKIAEARIVYGGEGNISDVQQPAYGQQLYDIVFPF